MRESRTVAVIGLGLMGGSLARALSNNGWRVIAHDSDRATVSAAIAEGVVSKRLGDDFDDLREADVVVIAVPVDSAVDLLARIAPHVVDARLVTDVSSTKKSIVAAAETLSLTERFVGSHPFVGDHQSGWTVSRADLFNTATVFLCPTKHAKLNALHEATSFWDAIGAHPVLIDVEHHDELVGWRSHLPHLVSVALALALDRKGIERAELGRGGRDVTRIAGGSPEMWTAIGLDNVRVIEEAITAVIGELDRFQLDLKRADRRALFERLRTAHKWAAMDSVPPQEQSSS